MRKFILFLFCFACLGGFVEAQRWALNAEGGITWQVRPGDAPHSDHIEMSGLQVSTVVRYGVDANGAFLLNRGMVWPLLRTIPNNTHASLMRKMGWNPLENVLVGNAQIREQVQSISLDGTMTVRSLCPVRGGEVELTRVLFPSTSLPAFCEKYTLTAGFKEGETEVVPDVGKELQARKSLIQTFWSSLVFDSPDPVINTMFAFAKIRGAESIYQTAGGLMHGPGGESYYAAIWANDQAEYINPFFPFLGYDKGNGSALNSYKHFARFMNDAYKPIPSSIIAEGTDIWNGAGDRGDAAMIAYGAGRYALARGDRSEAEQLWPLIEWCLEYCRRQVNEQGVVASDADELENRFPAGDANLCTSSLYYDALNSAVYLGKALNKPGKQTAQYAREAKQLKKDIEAYFGATVEGFETYQYYDGNDILRSWICIPLTVGIYDRAEATIAALFSPRLWTENGLLTQAGSETFWDRSTLYALRGVYAAGETEKATEYLKFYSAQRLLGEHVPYAIEAWPEGNQRHLSAESGLYCRIITEGMFGIRPTGFRSFTMTPRLPAEWDHISLKSVRAFGSDFDISVVRDGEKLAVSVTSGEKVVLKKTIKEGQTLTVSLK